MYEADLQTVSPVLKLYSIPVYAPRSFLINISFTLFKCV